jgi:hypothetical protein
MKWSEIPAPFLRSRMSSPSSSSRENESRACSWLDKRMRHLSVPLELVGEAFACQKIPAIPEWLVLSVAALACGEAEKQTK